MSSHNNDVILIPSFIQDEEISIISFWKKTDKEKIQNFFSKIKKFSYLECKMSIDNSLFEEFCIKNFFIKAEIDGKDIGVNSSNYWDLNPEVGRAIYDSYVNYFNNSMYANNIDLYSNYVDILKGKFNGEVDKDIKVYFLAATTGLSVDELNGFEDSKLDKLYHFAIIRDNFKNADIINAMSIIFGGKSIL